MDPTPSAEAALLSRLAAALGGIEPHDRQRALILRLARDIAHAGERQDAPLAAFMIGRFVEVRRSAGIAEAQALAEAAELVGRVAPTSEPREDS